MKYHFTTYKQSKYRYASGMDMCASIVDEAVANAGRAIEVEEVVSPQGKIKDSQIRVNMSKYVANERLDAEYIVTTVRAQGVLYVTAIRKKTAV